MFLLYINDIITNVNSPLRIFADVCLLYRIIDTPENTAILQNDFDQITSWVGYAIYSGHWSYPGCQPKPNASLDYHWIIKLCTNSQSYSALSTCYLWLGEWLDQDLRKDNETIFAMILAKSFTFTRTFYFSIACKSELRAIYTVFFLGTKICHA